MFSINFGQWLDSNFAPLESEATALTTEPQHKIQWLSAKTFLFKSQQCNKTTASAFEILFYTIMIFMRLWTRKIFDKDQTTIRAKFDRPEISRFVFADNFSRFVCTCVLSFKFPVANKNAISPIDKFFEWAIPGLFFFIFVFSTNR